MTPTIILRQSKTWLEFEANIQELDKKKKGDCFEDLVFCYLRLHPNYATKLAQVWRLRDVPTKVRNYLNLPGPDEGIDIIAKTKEGEYWAVQCKYREDTIKSLSRRELSTFTDLAFGICRNIKLALVCTTAERFSRKLNLYGERISLICGDRWRELDNEFFDRLHKLISGKIALPKPLKPRPHQKRAIHNAHKYFVDTNNSRGKLIMPCAAGKSLAAYWIAEKLEARTVLIAVPSLHLIRQTLEVWARESLAQNKDIHWICVCSDVTVADFGKEDLAVLAQDLGIRIHTDPDEIAGWLRKRERQFTVVMTTYQSGKAIAEAARKAKQIFDIGIMDEAHKTTGKRGSLFSHLLYDENIKIKKRIFMTATERRYLGASDQIASMEDIELYGETFELLTFKEALASLPPILTDYRIITINVTREEISSLIRKNLYVRPDKGRWDGDVEAEMLAAAIALRKAIKKYRIRHALSFHSSIARARAFKATQDVLTEAFPSYGNLKTFHVSGALPTGKRKREIEDFEHSRNALITNARCLTEGVDVPNIDSVLFADPRKSTIDIVQAVGRALRPSQGKKIAYIIVPVLIDTDDSPDSLIQSGAFSPVLTVLRALAANDDRIIEYFRSISQGRRPRRGTYPVNLDVFVGSKINAEEFIKSIELIVWSRLAKLSWRPFEEARKFVRSLNLKSTSEWWNFCKEGLPKKGSKPPDIPAAPYLTYRHEGWISFGDWLGTGTVWKRKWRSFKKAREFARGLELKGSAEWRRYFKGEMPEDIPYKPERTYKNEGWISWGDWLGTGAVWKRKWRPFKRARKFARSLRFKYRADWVEYCKGGMVGVEPKPDDFPSYPNNVYKDKGWISWGDWLGSDYVSLRARKYRTFKQARKFARDLNLRGHSEWRKYCKGELPEKGFKPEDIPTAPNQVYRNKGWISFGDWLGTGTVWKREWRPFKQAREFTRSLNLKGSSEWSKYCKGELSEKGLKPEDIPSHPSEIYENTGWLSMGDWLGTGTIQTQQREYWAFKHAREFVQSLNLKNNAEWRKYCKGELPEKGSKPNDIPNAPEQVYRDKGWISFGDWLGTGTVRNRKWRPFKQAREFARNLNLKSGSEWRSFCKGELSEKGQKPNDIPSNPNQLYKDKGWISMGDWLGTGTIWKRKWRPFKQARKFTQSLNLKNGTEWRNFCKGEMPNKEQKPIDIPASPEKAFKNKGWIGMGDWLGTGNVAPMRGEFRPFKQAREFARSLNLKSSSEWQSFCKGELSENGWKPKDIPSNPNRVYKKQGWISMGNWLGTGNVSPRLREFRPFKQAREFARSLNLKSCSEWSKYCKGELLEKGQKPNDIHSNPHKAYKNKGWINWGDWLGTGTISFKKRKYRAFIQARKFARSLNLKSNSEWSKYCKGELPEKGTRPEDIPRHPRVTYKNEGWISIGDWLGKNK